MDYSKKALEKLEGYNFTLLTNDKFPSSFSESDNLFKNKKENYIIILHGIDWRHCLKTGNYKYCLYLSTLEDVDSVVVKDSQIILFAVKRQNQNRLVLSKEQIDLVTSEEFLNNVYQYFKKVDDQYIQDLLYRSNSSVGLIDVLNKEFGLNLNEI